MTAQAMVASAFTAPHVTEWVTVDVSATMELVERLKKDKEFRDVKVTPLLVLAKAMCLAVRRNPGINATWDEAAQEIVVKHYVNLGIAAATPRGLVVPNVKGADTHLDARARRRHRRPHGDRARGSHPAGRHGRAAPSPSPTSASSASTPAPRSSTRARRRSWRSAPSQRRPWVVTAADGTESIEPRWVTTLAL